jgi:hypothetical protein
VNVETLNRVIGKYREFFSGLVFNIGRRMSYDVNSPNKKVILGHCLWMIGEMMVFVENGKIEKAMRWLGFLQACLLLTGHFTLSDLRNHNSSKEES